MNNKLEELTDTFWRCRVEALSAYQNLFCRKDPCMTLEESSKLHQKYLIAWTAYKNSDLILFEYEARK